MVLRPHERAETAILLRSGQGTGKNIIADIFAEYFGIHGMVVTSPEQLVGRFTGHLGQCVFLFANEAIWGGDKKTEGTLKALITDEYRTVEEKYMPVTTVKNYVHLLLATNNDWAAPMDLDDRRFLVLDVSESKKGNREYFRELKHEIENGGKEALLHELLGTDISQFDHRKLPTNQGESKLIDQLKTADAAIRWWFECLCTGEITVEDKLSPGRLTSLMLGQCQHWYENKIKLDKQELHDSYHFYCSKHKVNYIHDKAILMKTLYDKFNIEGSRTFAGTRLNGKRKIKISSLKMSRELFEQAINNRRIQWEGKE